MQKKAFTLIELLVVIAIIAILAAILFPVFAQAKLAAKKTTDLSNIKQIGTSIAIYQNDSDDLYFTPSDPCYNGTTLVTCSAYLNGTVVGSQAAGLSGNSLTNLFWFYKLYPYTKSYTLFQNPTNSDAFNAASASSTTWAGASDANGRDWGGQNSYGYNAFYLSPLSSSGTYAPISPSSVPRIAGTIAMIDSTFHLAGPDVTNQSGLTVTSHLNTTSGTAESNYITGNGLSGTSHYLQYWENVGGGDGTFTNYANTPAQEVVKGPTMFNGKPNVQFVDGHAKSLAYAQAIGDICYWSTDADATHTNCSN